MSDEESTNEGSPSMNDWNAQVIEEFRANNGVLGGPFAGASVLLLHTSGAKSGLPRINPVMYLPKETAMYVFASKGGAPTNPDWYYNLRANPHVIVEVGSETFEAVATPVEGEARDRIYAEQAAQRPQFAEYESKTSRLIPVVELVRV
jgi:deazaflavin-dependent oxidoreductase (nitroreductase family)